MFDGLFGGNLVNQELVAKDKKLTRDYGASEIMIFLVDPGACDDR